MADMGTLTPEQMLQQQQILRQQKMAEMLMQQGMQQPQGQMISGRYVAPSIFQNLGNLANLYMGQRGVERAEQAQLNLAKQLREQGVQETQRLMNTFGGKPAGSDQVTEMAGPYGMSGAGQNVPMPTATIAGTPATPANPKLAYAEALNMQSPQARALLPFLAAEAFKKPKWEKAEYTDDKGRTRQGVIDVNSPDPISTFQVGGVKPEMSAYERASLNMRGAELNFQGIPVGGAPVNVPTSAPMNAPTGVPMGAPRSNVSVGGVPMGNAPVVPMANAPTKQINNAVPNTQLQYVNNPALSPKANQELAVKFYADAEKNVKNARDSFSVIKDAADIFNTGKPTSGGFQNIGTGVAEFFNIPTQAADADAQLTILGEKLTAQVPRFEGPQSDKDTEAYRAAAGNLGNSNKTISSRMSALKTLIDLNKKYYPQGDWDSIDLAGPVTTKQTFLKGSKSIDPVTFSQGLNAQDKEAFNWARKNPTDPRAAQINQRLGIR
jgi:hypothetical protein